MDTSAYSYQRTIVSKGQAMEVRLCQYRTAEIVSRQWWIKPGEVVVGISVHDDAGVIESVAGTPITDKLQIVRFVQGVDVRSLCIHFKDDYVRTLAWERVLPCWKLLECDCCTDDEEYILRRGKSNAADVRQYATDYDLPSHASKRYTPNGAPFTRILGAEVPTMVLYISERAAMLHTDNSDRFDSSGTDVGKTYAVPARASSQMGMGHSMGQSSAK